MEGDDIPKIIESVNGEIQSIHNIPGQSFNIFFRDMEWLATNHKNNTTEDVKNLRGTIERKEAIIFSPNIKELESMDEVKGKVVFPFDKIFLEYPAKFIENVSSNKDYFIKFTNGFYLEALKNKEGKIDNILLSTMFLDYGSNPNNLSEEGVTPLQILIPYDQINEELMFSKDMTEEQIKIMHLVKCTLRKICYLIQKKNYGEYYKWTPNGIVKKEIIFSHDVKSHKRHFWKDSGKFKIPFLSNEELIKNGYGIDECVFRGYELRRDVPYKIIGSYKTGQEKIKTKDNNRIINILKKIVFKNEQKLGFILSKIFPSEQISIHDRRRIKPLELDFYIHNLNLAFEYDGEQHYDRKICEEVFKSDFEAQKQRDKNKDLTCRRKNIKLIRVKYDEKLTLSNIKNILKLNGVNV